MFLLVLNLDFQPLNRSKIPPRSFFPRFSQTKQLAFHLGFSREREQAERGREAFGQGAADFFRPPTDTLAASPAALFAFGRPILRNFSDVFNRNSKWSSWRILSRSKWSWAPGPGPSCCWSAPCCPSRPSSRWVEWKDHWTIVKLLTKNLFLLRISRVFFSATIVFYIFQVNIWKVFAHYFAVVVMFSSS